MNNSQTHFELTRFLVLGVRTYFEKQGEEWETGQVQKRERAAGMMLHQKGVIYL